jgi:signal peptidase I
LTGHTSPVIRPPRLILELVETLLLTLLIFFVIQTFVAQPFQVEQGSMEHTLEPGQFVLVDKLSPRWDSYHRGDIVVLQPPQGWEDASDTPFVKRIIGLPGDRIEIRDDGLVYVNGAPLDEASYTFQNPDGENAPTKPLNGTSSWLLGPDQLFVMGDHREASTDSRVFGPIDATTVVGRAFLRYWPATTFGILAAPSYP